jgi:glyoxylase-like metal-dependent hydrolase (beta-lactamase superfamily II)
MLSDSQNAASTRDSLPRAASLDLEFLGYPEAIASCLMQGDNEIVLVDSGPASCLPSLKKRLAEHGLNVTDLTHLLLTHIHLDHAGAAGSLVKENPRLQVYVHSIGAKHLADPTKLLASAARLYGDAMQKTYGEFLAVPRENLHALEGGETLHVADRAFEVAYTPGHASHHVSYFDQANGTCFIGDTTGMRLPQHDFVAPVAPPPDIDLEAWTRSLAEVERRDPARLFLTHFGPFGDIGAHLDRTREGLRKWSERAARILQAGGDEQNQIAQFTSQADEEIRAALPEENASRYIFGASPLLSWYGLARYWKKRTGSRR